MKNLIKEKVEQVYESIKPYLAVHMPRVSPGERVNSIEHSKALRRYLSQIHIHPINQDQLKLVEAYYKSNNDDEFNRILTYYLLHLNLDTGRTLESDIISNYFERELVNIVNHLAIDMMLIENTRLLINDEDFSKLRMTNE